MVFIRTVVYLVLFEWGWHLVDLILPIRKIF
nr:MAG TPA: hypothetical protein [Caudoviricetes sp.]